MAVTSVWPVKRRLDHVLNYAMNPEKTGEHPCHDAMGNVLSYVTREEKAEYVTGVNCLPKHANQQMRMTKEAWGKTGGRLAYHGYQSFALDEVTPAQAHEIGVELARRMWGDRFQVVVATHTDQAHVHTHFVINSVSFVDGKKYVHTKRDYYGGVRVLSDEICREHGLGVVVPKGRGKQYKEAVDERAGKPTRRSLLKADVLEAIEKSPSFSAFVALLESRGYAVKHGPQVKHIAVQPKDAEKPIRLYKLLGEDYEESGIRAMIESGRVSAAPTATVEVQRPARKKPRRFWLPQEHKRHKGIVAAYYKYLFLLGKTGKRKVPQRVSFALRAELAKLDRYRRQFRFLCDNRIESTMQLSWYADALQNEIAILVERRKPLYTERQQASEPKRPAISAEVEAINMVLRPLRRKQRLCAQILLDADAVLQKTQTVQALLERPPAHEKEKTKTKASRNIM